MKARFLIILFLFFSQIWCKSDENKRRVWVSTERGDYVYLYKNKFAYTISVSNYEKLTKLPNAIKDAEEISNKLKKLGFEVRNIIDPDYETLNKFIRELPDKLEGKDRDCALLLYFIGHGFTEKLADGRLLGYFAAKDAKEEDIKLKSINMQEILTLSERLRNNHVLIIFDCCFSGSIFSLMGAKPTPVYETIMMPVRQFISAGKENEEVPDNSIFTKYFLKGLDGEADKNNDGFITGSEIGEYLQDKVSRGSTGSQNPQFGKIRNSELDKGEFVFAIREDMEMPEVPKEGSAFIMPKEKKWYVYKDATSEENHGEWTNWMGEKNLGDMMELSLVDNSNPFSGDTSIKVSVNFNYSDWGGIAIASISNYWGDKPSNFAYNLSGAKKLIFYARGERGGEMIQIKVGIVNDKPYGDSTGFPVETQWISLSREWKRYELSLEGRNLKRIITPFAFVTNKEHNRDRVIKFYLDEIYFEMK